MSGIADLLWRYESLVRLGFFMGVLLLMAGWERMAPCRRLSLPQVSRWANNLGLMLMNSVLLRLLFPAGAVGLAMVCLRHGWGLLNYVHLSHGPALILSIMLLDLAIYGQHVMFHAVPLLWRLHRVHHADLDCDVTTAVRFHPFEIILSMLIKWAVIVVLGPPILGVVIFEVLLNVAAMFNHANVDLPVAVDRCLRWFIVTPDMHRVHHSMEEREMNRNFGFNLACWDKLFGTYQDQPVLGHEAMVIGLRDARAPYQVNRMMGMLSLPFVNKANVRRD